MPNKRYDLINSKIKTLKIFFLIEADLVFRIQLILISGYKFMLCVTQIYF